MRLTALASKEDTAGETFAVDSLAELRAVLEAMGADSPVKDSAPCWLAGLNAGSRKDEDMRELCVWVLDYDQGEPDWSKLGGWDYIAHTTHSSTPEAPKWRVIVALDGLQDAATWKAKYKAKVAMHALSAATDGKTCNPSRIWYVPPPGAEWRVSDGQFAATWPETSAVAEQVDRVEVDRRLQELQNDLDVTVQCAEMYVDHEAPRSVMGENGSGTTLNVACVLVTEFALSDEPAWLLLQKYNETKCDPPWSDAELRHKFRDAHRDSVHVPGARLGITADAIREERGIVDPEYAALFVDLSTLTLEPIDWFCEGLGIVPGRPTMFLSYPGTGKSTAGAALAVSCATGAPVFGAYPIKRGRVCMIDNEATRGTQRQVLRLLRGAGAKLEPGSLVMVPRRLKLTKDEDWRWIERVYREFDLVIIDSLHASSPGLDENAVEFAESLDRLAGFSELYGRAHVVHHHAGKADPKKLGSQIFGRGSSAIDGSSGAQWAITKDADGTIHWRNSRAADGALAAAPGFVLQLQTTNGSEPGQEGVVLRSRPEEGAEVGGAAPGAAAGSAGGFPARVLAELKKFDRWVSASELKMRVPGPLPAFRDVLALLCSTGRVGAKIEGGRTLYHRDPGQTPLS